MTTALATEKKRVFSRSLGVILLTLSVLVAAAAVATVVSPPKAGGSPYPVWSTKALPFTLKGPAYPEMAGVSCTPGTPCVAVGWYSDGAGVSHPVVEIFSGSTWTASILPAPPGIQAELSGVSCTGTSCVAVGSVGGGPLVETLSGSTWTATDPPMPTGAGNAYLAGVSCTSPTSCTAVGGYLVPSGPGALVETLSGTTWTATGLPNPSGSNNPSLSGVSCTGATSCVAVGSYNDSSYATHSLVEVLAGTTWTASELPDPTGATHASLSSVSCTAATSCVAVGQYADSSYANHSLVETLAGSTWTATELADPSGSQNPALYAVSCTGATSCVAVGSWRGFGFPTPIVETLAGTTWAPTSLPVPSGASGAGLLGVSCSDAGACLAAGTDWVSSTTYHALIETLAGSTWTATVPKDPDGLPFATISSVSCTSATSCAAVGYYETATGDQPLVETLSGTTWAQTDLPEPPGAVSAELSGVSCTSATSCMAAGWYELSSMATFGLVETLSAGTWTATELAQPAGAQRETLAAVSCTSEGACVAVGTWNDTSTRPHALVETLSGTTWTPTALSDPSGTGNPTLVAVSCTSATSCVAVGYYNDSSMHTHALVETLASTTWTATLLTDPAETQNPSLAGISCISATSCVAVGGYSDSMMRFHALVETLSGSAWTPTLLSDPAGAQGAGLSSVSCSGPSCTAAGGYGDTMGHRHSYVDVVFGSTWTPIELADPSKTVNPSLEAISCASDTSCLAAGSGINTSATGGNVPVVAIGPPDTAPVFTSASSVTFTVGKPGTFTVTATGYPVPTFRESGKLPKGVAFTSNSNSTATLAGTPAARTGDSYAITITATSGAIGTAQPFRLTVNQAPTITTAASTTFTVGKAGKFVVKATGYPSPTFNESGKLPKGVTFTSGTGSATLAGTPAAATGGTYKITVIATNAAGSQHQAYTLVVDQVPAITTASSATFVIGKASKFVVKATGYPASTFSETGKLPNGVTFTSGTGAAAGTATLAGKPAAGTGGKYKITVTAKNSAGSKNQAFTLTVT